MSTNTKPKATLVSDKAMVELLKRKVIYAANRFQAILPLIAALNAAGKSQADAAAALGTTVCTLRMWLDITGTTWVNLKKRGPYKTRHA